MSTTIEQKVVEMRFDNRHFEKNVQGTLSTLDKLKQKLNLTGASKGLEQINTSANKVNMNGLSNALTTVSNRFSVLQVMGVTALANITNSAVNAGKNIARALTIEPVTTGFKEYELKMDSVKTIMASTGASIQTVNKYLEELNAYSDQTIYSFSDMTQNIGKFTNAGVELKDAVLAIKGISNAAALSGANANEASRAMYNFAQALSVGYIQRIDWKSIELANMATVEFKEQLLDSAIAMGTVTKNANGMYATLENPKQFYNASAMFTETLDDQWLTSEVLIKTLKEYSDATTDIGKRAYAAAQDVTKLTQVFDIAKEVAQSGWARSWEIIFGNLEEAKKIFTGLSEFITKIQMSFINFRNNLLEGALGKNFKSLAKKLSTIMDPLKKTAETVKDTTKQLKTLQKMVREVIRGDWGNGHARLVALTEAGYNYYAIQNKVNEQLGYSFRYSEKLVKSAEKNNKVKKESIKTQNKLAKSDIEYIERLIKMSDAELRAADVSEEQIKALRELQKYSDKTGLSIRDFIANIDELDGRWLLINSFKNAGKGLVQVFTAFKDAWVNAFPPLQAEQLFDIIAALHKFSTNLVMSEETVDELTRTLKGVFAIVDLFVTLFTSGFKIAFTIFETVLGAFNLNILQFTALIGDGVVKIRDWIDENNLIIIGIKYLVEIIIAGVVAIKKWLSSIDLISTGFNNLKKALKSIKDSIVGWFENLAETENVGEHIMAGLKGGLLSGFKDLLDAMIEIGKGLLEAIKKVLGIHSPSTEFFEIGENIMTGLLNGLSSGLSTVVNFIKSIGEKAITAFKTIDFGKVLAAIVGVGMIVIVMKLLDIIQALTMPMISLANLVDNLGDAIENFSVGVKAKLKAEALKARAEAIRIIATSVLILAGAIVMLSKIEPGTLWATIGAITALVVVLGALAFAASKIDSLGDFGKSTLSILAITMSLLLAASAMKKLASIEPENMKTALKGFAAMIAGLSVLMLSFNTLAKNDQVQHMKRIGQMLTRIALALLIMVTVIKLAALLSGGTLIKGIAVIGILGTFIGALIAVSSLADEHANSAGKMIKKIAFALLIMVGVIKLASLLEGEEILKGMAVISALGSFFSALIFVSLFAGKHAAKAGAMMLEMSIALGITVMVIHMISSLNMGEIIKGLAVISALGTLFAALTFVSLFAGQNAIKAGAMLLMVSSALLILTGVVFLLSKMDTGGLIKALGVVTVLEVLFGGLIYVSQYAENSMASIITITVAVLLLVGALVGLSFINPQKLMTAGSSISMIIGALALLVASTKLLGGPGNIVKTLFPMVAIIGLLGGIITVMSKLDVKDSIANATALSMLLIALSVSLAIAGLMGSVAMTGVTALALMTLIIISLSGLLAFMSQFDTSTAMTTVKALSVLLLSMSASLILLGVVGLLGPAAFIGIAALAALIVALGAVVIAIGALASKFPVLEEFLNKGIPILEKIGYALGAFFGNIVGGFMSGVSNGLPNIGTNLSLFMSNLSGFIEGAKKIDGSVIKGIASLSAALVLLTASNYINAIISFLSGGNSFAQLGTELSDFINNASGFIDGASAIDPSVMEGVKTIAEAILILTGAQLLNGITSFITGDKSFASFGAELGVLATSLNTFATNLGTFDKSKLSSVDCACDAIKALAEAAKSMPGEGGLWQALAGEKSLASFSGQLPWLATNLNAFVTNLGEFDKTKVTTTKNAGKAITALAEAAKSIPAQEGLWQALAGEKSLASFGDKLPGLGTNLKSFLTNLGEFDEKKVVTVDCAGKAISALADAAKKIPKEDGFWQKLAGEKSLASFGGKLPGLGKNISSFVSNLGEFSEAQVTTVNSACEAIKVITGLGKIDIGETGEGLGDFGGNMVKFAKKVKTFVEHMGEVGSEGINSAITKTNELIAMAQTIASTNIDSVKTFGNSLKDVAKDGVKGFVKAFSGVTPKNDAKAAVKALLGAVIEGAEEKKSSVEKKFKKVASAGISAIDTKDMKENAANAGENLVIGFANGIKNNQYRAALAGRELGKAALNAAKAALDEHSPSKEAEKVGAFFGEGLVIGIKDYESKTYDAGYSIADRAKVGLSKAISKISSIVANDIDSQPTIRPVLDLSEVESGAGYLNNMFNNPSIGVMSNINAINAGMKARNQNGINDDVVSAIDDLRRDLGTVGGVTNNYNVNGVTYDDGSNITDAVRTIVRAAIMERRV